MLKKVDVAIDSCVIIPCPEKEFKPRRAANSCPDCEHFKGIGLMSEDNNIKWHQKYVIRCAGVIERRTQLIPEVIEN